MGSGLVRHKGSAAVAAAVVAVEEVDVVAARCLAGESAAALVEAHIAVERYRVVGSVDVAVGAQEETRAAVDRFDLQEVERSIAVLAGGRAGLSRVRCDASMLV